jgi:hypothetical protein
MDGRKIVFTKCFCASYGQLAKAAASYFTIFEEFRNKVLASNGSPITVDFTARLPEVAPRHELAVRVVERLLSGSAVCVVDAAEAEMIERLKFIDDVMSLLPYGLRSQMSASTWTSSTTQRHKFRLFFSSSPRASRDRDEQDHVVSWLENPKYEQVGHFRSGHRGLAARYVTWLKSWEQPPIAQLAELTEQRTFTGRQDIEHMLDQVEKLPRPHRRSAPPTANTWNADLWAPDRSADAPQPQMPWDWQPPVSQDRDWPDSSSRDTIALSDLPDRIEYFLNCCARQLEVPHHAGLAESLQELNNLLDRPEFQNPERRRRYWQIIIDRGLLRWHFASSELPLCETLLRTAFGRRPVTYEVYCQIEDSLGTPPHPALVETIDRLGASAAYLQVIIYHSLGDNVVMDRLRTGRLDVGDLIREAATEELKSQHFRIVCGAITRALDDPSIQAQMPSIRTSLRRHGYLAPMLHRREPNDRQYQINILSKLLLCGLGGKLSRRAATEVLSNLGGNAPTPELLAAVNLQLLDPADALFVLAAFGTEWAKNAGLDRRTRDELVGLFAPDDQPLPATLVDRSKSRSKPSMPDTALQAAHFIDGERDKSGKKRKARLWPQKAYPQPPESSNPPQGQTD